MRTSFFLFILLYFSVFNLKAQEKPSALVKGESATVSDQILKIETLFPNLFGLSYETKLGQHFSLYNMIGLFGYYGGGAFAQALYGANPYYILMPQITIQPRFYYDIGKRAATDKKTTYNSANYVGFSARVYHEKISISNADRIPFDAATLDLLLSSGIQRSFFKRLNADLAIGPGIRFSQGEAEFLIGLNLQLGFVLFSN